MGILYLLPRQRLVEDNLEAPVEEVGHIVLEAIPQLALVILVAAAQGAALDAQPLEQDGPNVGLGHLRAAEGAEHDDPGVPRRDVEVLLKVRAADKVDDEVDALAARLLLDLGRPVLRLVVERGRGANLVGHEAALFVGAGGGVDGGRAGDLGQLDSRNGDARGARVPQDGLALGEAQDEVQRLRRRDPVLRQRGALLVRQLARLAQQHLGAHGNVLCVRAAVGQAKHLVAGLEEAVVAGAKRLDDAAELDAQRRGCLWRQRVHAAALDNVHAVDAKGGNLDNGLALCRGRLGGLGVDVQCIELTLAALDVCDAVLDGLRNWGSKASGRGVFLSYQLLSLFRPL